MPDATPFRARFSARVASGGVIRSWRDEWFRAFKPAHEVWFGGTQVRPGLNPRRICSYLFVLGSVQSKLLATPLVPVLLQQLIRPRVHC